MPLYGDWHLKPLRMSSQTKSPENIATNSNKGIRQKRRCIKYNIHETLGQLQLQNEALNHQ